ncbi:MAG: electron transfer flavoprotein subunit alpha/FixB family protein [Deltaproteobacteria bacterium]|nr:electron transfer flavoprotein subunit alpha/FixB family protein [Deltaproteobacteria bacterium]MBW2048941.1 electron transfer flavoprotein subunit alpha/FixB family protein [Deltaproteobacteria bacterium]MBW2110854.1 electron transfer flavoprotein subunit alpha/FixB family protein [Deltaproteobacteria bacterium]MBW2352355.1 electron transfer flavoprotein subunit alpha/FixB family protein [Deltaproteobacteria bacterium]
MGEIFVIAEHRMGEIREITFEMLFKARELCKITSSTLTAVLLAGKGGGFAEDLAKMADRVIRFEDERLEIFDADTYKEVIDRLIRERAPLMTLMGHTSWGLDLAPALAVRTGYPLVTDCVDIRMEEGRPVVSRQIYSGKLFSKVRFRQSAGYLITVRPGAFPPPDEAEKRPPGDTVRGELPPNLTPGGKEFVEFVEAGAGELDITQAELLISIGRGVGEEEKIAPIRELSDRMGATLSCSRPVVDKNWLPKYHQVGTSGKSVRPKVYLALGISGAFQHVAGITGAGTVIAVNRDRKAPIFRVADYGVVDDLFKVADALKDEL